MRYSRNSAAFAEDRAQSGQCWDESWSTTSASERTSATSAGQSSASCVASHSSTARRFGPGSGATALARVGAFFAAGFFAGAGFLRGVTRPDALTASG